MPFKNSIVIKSIIFSDDWGNGYVNHKQRYFYAHPLKLEIINILPIHIPTNKSNDSEAL